MLSTVPIFEFMLAPMIMWGAGLGGCRGYQGSGNTFRRLLFLCMGGIQMQGKGKFFVCLFPPYLFPQSIVAGQGYVDADKLSCKFASCVSCDGGPSSCGFPSFVVLW